MDDVIKNPARSSPQIQKKYEPEYKRLNKNPIEQNQNTANVGFLTSNIKRGSNNMESSLDSIDGSSFDEHGNEVKIVHGHIIDNNDFVDYIPTNNSVASNVNENFSENVTDRTESSPPEINSYILMVFGKLILSGSLSDIEFKVKSILYKEDKEFNNLDVDVEDIVVLKRVNIKVGVFIDG